MEKIQLVCISYAGGTAEAFSEVSSYLPKEIKTIALDYAGHGSRRMESFYETFEDMVEDMAIRIKENVDKTMPLALFGYSMGSVVAYELVARGMLERKAEHLFLAAHEAPGEYWDSRAYEDMDDLNFLHKLQEFGGFRRLEDRFLDNRHFRKMLFDPIRADYHLISDYKLKHDIRPGISTTMFYSPLDVPTEKIQKWENHFSVQPEFIEIGKNHFFINEYPQELAKLIAERLEGIYRQ